jgi:hypothetical protein
MATEKIIVAVGMEFTLVDKTKVKHISLKGNRERIEFQGMNYPIFKGSTFADSKKVDELLDSGEVEIFKLKDYPTWPSTVEIGE